MQRARLDDAGEHEYLAARSLRVRPPQRSAYGDAVAHWRVQGQALESRGRTADVL